MAHKTLPSDINWLKVQKMKATLKLLMVLTLLSRIDASNSRQLHGEEEELISSEDFKAGMEANECKFLK